MPPLGQTSDEIDIVGWLKSPGDEVAEGEPLLTVDTDKATLEVEAASSGVLLAIVHDAGATVIAGDVIGWIGEPGEEIPADEPPAAAAPTVAAAQPQVRVGVEPVPLPDPAGRVLATPGVRALARGHGVDLEQVQGSGPGGRIEREDVLAAVDGATADPENPPGD